MKKIILICLLLFGATFFAEGQYIFDGFPMDSTTVNLGDSASSFLTPDSAAVPLWQNGITYKSFFATGSTGSLGIMTDTTLSYPPMANNFFTLNIPIGYNVIVDFWHHYQTDSIHAGGVVEFSQDGGVTWQNIKGPCNTDSILGGQGILTNNFYGFNDTLFNGMPAFTGTNTGLYSRLQFFFGFPVKATSGGCSMNSGPYFLRFRFISDSTVDSLAGWKIDSVKIEQDLYEGIVTVQRNPKLLISPNPSTDGLFNFPELENTDDYQVQITDQLGRPVLSGKYRRVIDLSAWPAGFYYYRATDGHTIYDGKLQRE